MAYIIQYDRETILNDVKDYCNVEIDDHNFDGVLLGLIETALSVMKQVNAVKVESVSISDSTLWDAILTESAWSAMVKQYVKDKCKLAFDPPANATLMSALEKRVSEMEWRAMTESEVFDSLIS